MTQFNLFVNGITYTVDVDPQMPLLWILRDVIGLTGTKYGCGIAACGACTVHLNGSAIRSCVMPVSTVAEQPITTIEGLNHAVLQQAWRDEVVPQCGYCQSGQLMVAADLLSRTPEPTLEEVEQAMNGVICRCGTYQRIRNAILRAAEGA